MSFSTGCASNLVPLLSRLVLAGAFVTVGWHKIMGETQFIGEQAQALIDLGVVEAPSNTEGEARGVAWRTPITSAESPSPGAPARPPRPDREQPTTPAAPTLSAAQDAPAEPDDAADPADVDEEESDSVVDELEEAAEQAQDEIEEAIDEFPEPREDEIVSTDPVTGPVVVAKPLHSVTLLLASTTDWDDYAPHLAWANALTELFGGALILIGLFSRLWGLALAVVMAAAFYVTSAPALAKVNWDPFAIPALGDGYATFNTMYCQLALFVLALGIFLTGAGAVSLDRLIFRRRVVEDEVIVTDSA